MIRRANVQYASPPIDLAPSADDLSLVRALRRASRELVRELGLVGPRHPVVPCSVGEGHLVLELQAGGALRLPDLAERLRLTKSTVSRLASALRRRRLVEQFGGAADRRLQWLRLTPRGRRMARRLDLHADRQVGAALGLLARDERTRLLGGLAGYADALRRSRLARAHVVRAIEPGEDAAMLAILRQVRVEFGAREANYPVEEPADRHLHATFSRPRSRYFVAAAGRRVVGGAGIAPLAGGPPDTCELQRMYLLPRARGIGLGAALVERCAAVAPRLGFKAIYAETLAAMDAANALYSRLGFERLPAPLGATGHTHTDTWLLKRLVDAPAQR